MLLRGRTSNHGGTKEGDQLFGPLLSLQVAHFRFGHELSLDVYSLPLAVPIRSLRSLASDSKSVGRNIWTPRPVSGPQRISLSRTCSSFTRSLRRTWWSLFTQRPRIGILGS